MNYLATLTVAPLAERQIVVSRVFDAPTHLVYQAFTKPHLVSRWLLGPDGWSMPVCNIDLRVGGAYRYVWQQDSDSTQMGVGGVFREIVPNERIVSTEKFDISWYGGEALLTLALHDEGGKTSMTLTLLYESTEARDSVLRSDMEKGIAQSYDRLADQLASTPNLDEPRIVQTVDQPVAMIHLTVPRSEIQNVMMPGIQEAYSVVGSQGVEITGPWLSHHLRMNPEVFDFEICVPVASPVSPSGRVILGCLHAAKVAQTVYHGPYEGLGDAWHEFVAWIRSEGLNPRDDLWERYLTGPETSQDPADWCTELNQPLVE